MILHPVFFILGCGTMLRASDSNASDIAALPAENAPWHKKMYYFDYNENEMLCQDCLRRSLTLFFQSCRAVSRELFFVS